MFPVVGTDGLTVGSSALLSYVSNKLTSNIRISLCVCRPLQLQSAEQNLEGSSGPTEPDETPGVYSSGAGRLSQ